MRVVAKRPRDKEPYTAAERQARWRAAHPVRAKEVRDQQRIKRRELIAAIKKEAGCARCGIDDPRVLDFHHRNADEKTLAVSQLISKTSWQAILDEVARCDVLCANCHRIAHAEESEAVAEIG
jgi:hypothetical protein